MCLKVSIYNYVEPYGRLYKYVYVYKLLMSKNDTYTHT